MIKSLLISKWHVLVFCLIITLGIFSRLWQLGTLPAGITWDEAAIGYNGWSIWHTRRDEWIERLPLSFKSFDDYKAPLAIYLNGPFTYLGQLTPFYVRLPFALSGQLATLIWTLLLRKLMPINAHSSSIDRLLWLTGIAFFTLSPTLIHFSRVGFESGLALTLILGGLILTIYALDQLTWIKSSLWFGGAGLLMALSLYTYHSAKISLPILILLILIYLWRKKQNLMPFLIFVSVIGVLSLPLIKDSLWGNGLSRATGVTIFTHNLNLLQLLTTWLSNIISHLKPQYLLFGETDTLRHSALSGIMTWPVGILFYLSVPMILIKKLRVKLVNLKSTQVGLLLLISGLAPAIIGIDVPHTNRALLAVPGMMLLAFSTLQVLTLVINQKKTKWGLYFGLTVFILILSSSGLQIFRYFNQYNKLAVEEFNQGYLEAVKIARDYEKGINGRPKVDQIVFDSNYGQPYIYTLFGNSIPALAYQHGALVKYLFTDRVGIGDTTRKNTLLVATDQTDLLEERATHVIRGQDGSVRFIIYYLPP